MSGHRQKDRWRSAGRALTWACLLAAAVHLTLGFTGVYDRVNESLVVAAVLVLCSAMAAVVGYGKQRQPIDRTGDSDGV